MDALELNASPSHMGLAPVHNIVHNLDRMYGRENWPNYELETLSLDMGFTFDELTQDKLNVLQLVIQEPKAVFTDVLFFLHTVSVINNNIADFDTLPLPSSLEIAYAHEELKKIFGTTEYGPSILKTIAYILTLEGYSYPVPPFGEMGITKVMLHEGQTEQDTKDKEAAVKQYLEGMLGDPQ